MPGSNPIYYKDLVSPDDSIERLIKELNQLKSTYSDILDLVKKGAAEILLRQLVEPMNQVEKQLRKLLVMLLDLKKQKES